MSWTQCPMGSELNVTSTLAGNTTEISGVAAEAVELAIVIEEDRRELVASPTVPLVCFPIQGSVYSLFSLFEDQALKLVGFFVDVLSCSGLSLLTLLC